MSRAALNYCGKAHIAEMLCAPWNVQLLVVSKVHIMLDVDNLPHVLVCYGGVCCFDSIISVFVARFIKAASLKPWATVQCGSCWSVQPPVLKSN